MLAYDTLKEPLREILNSAAVRGDGLWRDDIADLYERDSAARNPDNAYPWFRFYMTQRWTKLKLGSRSEAELAAA
ncbi:MAG: hypothetical protein IH986_14165 [Planctomycetes bacterium]|nr:hypothetical protein [Planctomycetota bacterium]